MRKERRGERERENSQRASTMKHKLKSEHTCAHTVTHTHCHMAPLSGHGCAWQYRCLVRVCLIIQSQAGVISKMCYEAIVLREMQKDRRSTGTARRLSAEGGKKKKSMLGVVTNKLLLSGLIQGWLLYLRGQCSIEGLLLLYKWSVFSFSWGWGQGLSTCPCALCHKWWSRYKCGGIVSDVDSVSTKASKHKCKPLVLCVSRPSYHVAAVSVLRKKWILYIQYPVISSLLYF